MKHTTTLALLLLAAPAAWPQGLDYVKAHYTKHEYPIMLLRTPYSVGPYGEDN